MKAFSLLVATCLVGLAHHVAGYSSGAPPDACEDLVPKHKVPRQKGPSPYIITASKKEVKGGDNVKLTITGKNGEEFKGFMCQTHDGQGNVVGHFRKNDGFKVIDCNPGQQNAVTHIDSDKKSKIEVTWVAPQKHDGSVTFVCTVAKDGGTFWVAEKSESITVT